MLLENQLHRAAIIAIVLTCLPMASCVPLEVADDRATRPDQPSNLSVAGIGPVVTVFTGMTASFTAAAFDGMPPYFFRWDQNGGPAMVSPSTSTTANLTTGPLSEPGRYVFRVVATDSAGNYIEDYVPILVVESVTASIPPLAIVNESTPLSANIDETPIGTNVLWEVTRGSATFNNPASTAPRMTALSAETIGVTLTVEIPVPNEPPFVTVRDFEIVAIVNLSPEVLVETTLGDFIIELDAAAAPLHTANFLLYVDDGFYDNLLIHRVVCRAVPEPDDCKPFVIQGGGFRREDGEIVAVPATRDPVPSESENGRSNGELYSVSLALTGGNRNSGTTQFFVNLDEDNASLDAQGFTVFGLVTGGTEVVDAIVAVETEVGSILGSEQSLPVDDILIVRMVRLAPDPAEDL